MPFFKCVSGCLVAVTLACSLSISGSAHAATYSDIIDHALGDSWRVPDISQHLPDPFHLDVAGVRVDIDFDNISSHNITPVVIDRSDGNLHISSSFFDVFVELPAFRDHDSWPCSRPDFDATIQNALDRIPEPFCTESCPLDIPGILGDHDIDVPAIIGGEAIDLGTTIQDALDRIPEPLGTELSQLDIPGILESSGEEESAFAEPILTKSQDLASYPVGEMALFEASGGAPQASSVPEPTSLALWSGLGIMSLIAARRRRKQAA